MNSLPIETILTMPHTMEIVIGECGMILSMYRFDNAIDECNKWFIVNQENARVIYGKGATKRQCLDNAKQESYIVIPDLIDDYS
jgi:hypothetical protein